MNRWVLDAGAFVAFDRGDEAARARIRSAQRRGQELVTTSPVIVQVWRDARQVMLARLVAATYVDAPNLGAARRAGALLAKTKTHDAVDALLVGLARAGDVILTSDPDDIERLLDAARVKAGVLVV